MNYHVKELIDGIFVRLTLLNPYLKLNDYRDALLVDNNQLKINVSVVYCKRELQLQKTEWLRGFSCISTRAVQNRHANGDKHVLITKDGIAYAEFVAKSRFGPYFLWPQDFHPV